MHLYCFNALVVKKMQFLLPILFFFFFFQYQHFNKMKVVRWKCVLLLFSLCGLGYACKRKFVREIVERENCVQKRILNFICTGNCHGNESEKSQCSITTVRQKTVRIWCFERNNMVPVNVTVSVPETCSCTKQSSNYVYMPILK